MPRLDKRKNERRLGLLGLFSRQNFESLINDEVIQRPSGEQLIVTSPFLARVSNKNMNNKAGCSPLCFLTTAGL